MVVGVYLGLLKGDSVQIERTYFRVGWKNLTINLEKTKITVRGLTSKIKTLEDLNKNTNLNQDKNDSDLLFSNTEIILFFIVLFFTIISFLIYLIFIK